MKQVEHENIIHFYGVSMKKDENFNPSNGVSTAISDFCLVFSWYGNGTILEYLKKKPDINRFDLASTPCQIPHSWCLPAPTNSY